MQHRFNFAIPLPLNVDEENEDCLTVNVFVPQRRNATAGRNDTNQGETNQELLPVMIWIYGGGFAEGYAAGT